jgi:hypothetical protein
MKYRLLAAASALALAGHIASASATELLTNGGFETGNFSGWTAVSNGGTSGCGSNVWTVNATGSEGCGGIAAPISGTYAAFNTFDGQQGSYQLSQSFTVPNGVQAATLSFLDEYQMSYFGSPRVLEVQLFNGTNTTLLQTLYSTVPPSEGSQAWTLISTDVTTALAADAGQTVTFRLTETEPDSYSGPANFGIDNISLTVTSNVPEPATLALLATAMTGLGLRKRRRTV